MMKENLSKRTTVKRIRGNLGLSVQKINFFAGLYSSEIFQIIIRFGNYTNVFGNHILPVSLCRKNRVTVKRIRETLGFCNSYIFFRIDLRNVATDLVLF